MTKFADKLCDKLHDKICRQSLSTAADEYLTFWFLCIFLVSATHTKTSRAYIQLAVEGFPFCRSPLQVLARVPASVCIARTHAITGGRVHAPDRCREIGRQTLRHAGTCAGKRARGRTHRNRYQRLSKYWAENNLDGGVVPVGHKVYIGSCISLWAAR